MIYEITERDGTIFIKEHKDPIEQIMPTGGYLIEGGRGIDVSGILKIEGRKHEIIEDGGSIYQYWNLPSKLVADSEWAKKEYYVCSSDWERRNGCLVECDSKKMKAFHQIPKVNWWHKHRDLDYLTEVAEPIFYIKPRKYVCRKSIEVVISTSVFVFERGV